MSSGFWKKYYKAGRKLALYFVFLHKKYKQNNECKTIDNSIHIGENVIINNSNIANAESYITQEKSITPTEKWYKKIVWEVVVPIIVGIVIAVVVAILKIE